MDAQSGLPREQRHQREQVVAREGDAAAGRAHVGAGDVQEDRAAPFALGRIVVVADHDHQVVQPVVAPHPLVAPLVGDMDQPVVGGRERVVAPAVMLADRPGGQPDLGQHQPVVAEVNPAQREFADRRRAIALDLVLAHAACTDDAARTSNA